MASMKLDLICCKYNATRHYIYKYFVGHSAMMGQSLNDEKRMDIYDLGVAEGIKEMLALRGFTKE